MSVSPLHPPPAHVAPSDLRVTCLTKRWMHHTSSGGYDRLAQELGAHVVERRRSFGFVDRVAHHVWGAKPREKAGLIDYRFADYMAEWRVLASSWLRRPDVVHCLYGDEQLDLLLRRRWALRCPLVASFHVATFVTRRRFEELQKHLLGGIDAAIAVSRCQVPDLARWLGEDRVAFVPHGIDTDRFVPAEPTTDRAVLQFAAVGHLARDWVTLRRIVDACNAKRLPVRFVIVTFPECFGPFAGCENVELRSGVGEDDLVRLYQQTDALLLPLLAATANNAVLESLACGTPVISNRVGGIPDYVDDTCGWLYEVGEVAAVVDLIEQMCEDRQVADSRRAAARHKSLEFAWPRVAAQVRAMYQAAIDGRSPAQAAAAWAESADRPVA